MVEQIAATESAADSAMNWVLKNKLRAVFYSWASGITGCLAFQWTRPIPTQLKIIHSRVYAQAITIGALGAVAALETYAAANKPQKPADSEDDY